MKRPAAAMFMILAVVGAFLSIAAAQPAPSAGRGLTRATIGFTAPPFALTSIDGKRVSLANLHGKPVLVNFWASWCPPCREEMPRIQELHATAGDNVAILGVDLHEPRSVVQAFVTARGFTWTFLLDPQGSVASTYGVRVLPTSFFLDPNGVIRQVYTGPMTLGQMRSFLHQTEAAR